MKFYVTRFKNFPILHPSAKKAFPTLMKMFSHISLGFFFFGETILIMSSTDYIFCTVHRLNRLKSNANVNRGKAVLLGSISLSSVTFRLKRKKATTPPT